MGGTGDVTINATGGGGSGTVTSVSVVNASGFSGGVANPTTTPAITLGTTITGVLKGSGGALLQAVGDTDYQNPITLTTVGTSGASTFSGDTLNIPQYAGTTYTAGTGLNLTGSVFSIANASVTSGTYGSSTSIPSFIVNQQGQLTQASGNVVIAPAGTLTGTSLASNITNSSLVAFGATATVANANALNTTGSAVNVSNSSAPSVGYVLIATSPTAAVWSVIPAQGQLTYVFANLASSIAGYEQMVSLSNYVQGSAGSTSQTVSTGTLLQAFATNTGFPNITQIPIGNFLCTYTTTKASNAHTYFSYYQIYKRSSGGIETLIGTSANSAGSTLNTAILNTAVPVVISSPIILLSTDLIVVKVYATDQSSTSTIAVNFDGTTGSELTFPSAIVDATNFVPYTGATLPVNLGTNALTTTGSVTALNLVSTITTGTAPFTVTSTTQVANLNAATAGTASNVPGTGVTGTSLASSVTSSSLAGVGTILTGTWHGGTIAGTYLASATSAAAGIVKPDNTTITISGGVISAVGSAVAFGSVSAGTNTNALNIGSGGSLAAVGSGTIAATAVPASGLTGGALASAVTASSLVAFGAGIALGTPASGNLTNTTGYPGSALAGTSLASGITASSLAKVGALSSGSLASGFTAVTVPLGGTGDTSLTSYAVLCGGTTSTSAVQSIASIGSTGQVLTSNGAGALPTFQAAGGGYTPVSANLTGQTGAVASIATATVGASVATYSVSGYINVTANVTDTLNYEITFTDENNTSQTAICRLSNVATGGTNNVTTTATVAFYTVVPTIIRAKAATTITVLTVLAVGGGTITYDVGAYIIQLN